MENLYGIGITNRYQLFLDEDEDPLEVLKVQEQEKEQRKKTKLSEKENKCKQQDVKSKSTFTARKCIKETQNIKAQDHHKPKEEGAKLKGLPRPTSERKYNNDSREDRNNQKNRSEKIGGLDNHREERGERKFERRTFGEDQRDNLRGRVVGGPRGLARGRGRGGRGGYDGRGKREFDRQSGSDKTGIKAVDKRDGAGAHNWGSNRDAMEDMDTINRPSDDSIDWGEKVGIESPPATDQPPSISESKENTEGQNGVEGEETENPANTEEERKELTLDEWKALKGNRSKPQYNLRKAGEGEDLSQWKKMYALQKKKEEEEDEEEEEYDSADYPQRVGRQKHVLDIDITFADTRPGRGRGGRGAGRGTPRGAMRGPPRGSSTDNGTPREREPVIYGGPRNTSRQSAPKVDDEIDFPSLG